MSLPPLSPQTFDFIVQIDGAYAALTALASHHGGHLLYAGDLTEASRALIVAANIAGAATLAATSDPAAGKQALRDGVIDFLVTSLDEALRILKNEVRKREPAAVCVTASPEAIEEEMQSRGVLPDLVAPFAAQVAHNSTHLPQIINPLPVAGDSFWLTWRAAESPAQWLPKIDAIALATLAPTESPTRRWLQLAPRYLGRLTQSLRTVRTGEPQAQRFIEQLKSQIAALELRTMIELYRGTWDNAQPIRLEPAISESERRDSPAI